MGIFFGNETHDRVRTKHSCARFLLPPFLKTNNNRLVQVSNLRVREHCKHTFSDHQSITFKFQRECIEEWSQTPKDRTQRIPQDCVVMCQLRLHMVKQNKYSLLLVIESLQQVMNIKQDVVLFHP